MRTQRPESDIIDKLVLAEASAWLVKDGSAETGENATFQEWLAASPAHRRAFERVNDVWEVIPGALAGASRAANTPTRQHLSWREPRMLVPAAAALVLLLMCVAWTLLPPGRGHQRVYQTTVGGRTTLVLADHTRITLNTDTRVVVDYAKNKRRVWLKHGEVLLLVTENAARPFILRTGNSRITDLGTVFDVSHYSRNVAVTLLKGRVAVEARTDPSGAKAIPTVLKPGDRLTVHGDGVEVLDHPNMQVITAWQRGQLDFDDSSLAQAVAEINRYNEVHIRIAKRSVASLRISGVFSTDQPMQFASAAARLHGLRMTKHGNEIVLQ